MDGISIRKISKKLDVSEGSVQKYTSEETKQKLQKERIKTGSEKRKSIDREEFIESKFYKGVVAEEKVKTKFIELGYKVYEPLIRSVEDLIVKIDTEFKKVQVKHGTYRNGCVVADLGRSCNSYNDSMKAKCYHKDDVDIFVIYSSKIDKVYFVKFEDAPNHSINLRVEDPKKNDVGNIRWAKDYEIKRVLGR